MGNISQRSFLRASSWRHGIGKQPGGVNQKGAGALRPTASWRQLTGCSCRRWPDEFAKQLMVELEKFICVQWRRVL